MQKPRRGPWRPGGLLALRILAFTLCMLAAPRIAAAEWHVTPMLGATFAGRTTLYDLQHAAEKHHVDFGGAVSLLGAGVIGAETVVVFTPGFFETNQTPLGADTRVELKSSRTIAMMGNAVLTTPRRWTEYFLRPFVSGGVGMLRASETLARAAGSTAEPLPPVHVSMVGFNVGGGAVGFLSQRTGVRFDLRYYSSLHGTDHTDQGAIATGLVRLHYMTASIGLVLRR